MQLLWRAKGEGAIIAIGWTFLAVVWLGPTVQPWYLAWAMVMLAAVAEGRTRTMLIVVSIVASFLGLPGAVSLVKQFEEANVYLLALACLALLVLLAIPLVVRFRRAFVPAPEEAEEAAAAAAAAARPDGVEPGAEPAGPGANGHGARRRAPA